MVSATGRPDLTSNSATRSRLAESDAAGLQMGRSSGSRPSHTGCVMSASLDAIQLRLPWRVLISPLWPRKRMGCAKGHFGTVLVEKRLW